MASTPFDKTWRKLAELSARPIWEAAFIADLNAYGTTWHNGNDLDRNHGIDAEILLSSGQTLTAQVKALSAKYRAHASLTIEDYSRCPCGNLIFGDWDNCKAELYCVAYFNEAGDDFSDYVVVDAAKMKLLTASNVIRWEISQNTRDNARASFRHTPVVKLPQVCVIARKGFGLTDYVFTL